MPPSGLREAAKKPRGGGKGPAFMEKIYLPYKVPTAIKLEGGKAHRIIIVHDRW